MVRKMVEKNWKDALPVEEKADLRKLLEERSNSWGELFMIGGDGLLGAIAWAVRLVTVPVVWVSGAGLALASWSGASLMIGIVFIAPLVAFAVLCWLQWKTCKVWICMNLAVMSFGLVVNGPHLLKLGEEVIRSVTQ